MFYQSNKTIAATVLVLLFTLAPAASVLAQSEILADTIDAVEAAMANGVGEESVPEAPNLAEVNEGEDVVVAEEDASTALELLGSQAVTGDNYRREPLENTQVRGDFIVGPARFDLEMGPGDVRVVELTVTNRAGIGRVFSFSAEDTMGSETGERAIRLLGDQEGPYTFRDYISVPHTSFYLEHAERARIPVTISIPPDAEPGGRYGSILTSVTTNPVDAEDGSGPQPGSAIISRISTVFFIRTPGEEEFSSELIDFATKNDQRLFASGPVDFLIVTENFGNVHTTPYGRITITNILGEEVGVRNIDPWFVMPQSIRTREVSWDRELLIGRYTATVEVNRGYDDIIDTKSFAFWVIPWKLVGAVFLGLFLFFLLLRFFFSRFELKRKD